MELEKLKEYLGIVVDMEKDIYVQQNIIAELNAKIRALQIPQTFVDPSEPAYPKLRGNSFGTCLLITIALCPVIWFVTALIAMIINSFVGLFGGDAEWLILLSLVTPIIWIVCQIQEYRANSTYNFSKMAAYNAQYQAYQSRIKENELKRQKDREQRAMQEKLVSAELQQEEKSLERAKSCLDMIYSQNIIFPKYRNFVMVSSIYEYICAGRCTTLEGHEGAYNILEMEIRLDHIVTRLDHIIKQLEAIKANQYMIYSAIQDANQQSVKILESTNQMTELIRDFRGDAAQLSSRIAELQQSSAATAYHMERTQKELHYMNRMDYLTGRNEGTFYNIPPN